MSNETVKDTATIAAEALQEIWSIGNHSQFCDDAPDFDYAKTEEIAAVIRRIYGALQPASDLSAAMLHVVATASAF